MMEVSEVLRHEFWDGRHGGADRYPDSDPDGDGLPDERQARAWKEACGFEMLGAWIGNTEDRDGVRHHLINEDHAVTAIATLARWFGKKVVVFSGNWPGLAECKTVGGYSTVILESRGHGRGPQYCERRFSSQSVSEVVKELGGSILGGQLLKQAPEANSIIVLPTGKGERVNAIMHLATYQALIDNHDYGNGSSHAADTRLLNGPLKMPSAAVIRFEDELKLADGR